MAYFSYSSLAYLKYPTSISGIDTSNSSQQTLIYTPGTTTISQLGIAPSATLITPFVGDTINSNFYYLACSAIDNTTRIGLIESTTVASGSTSIGYLSYNGLIEYAGKFYSGSPLSLFSGASSTYFSTSITFNCSISSTFALGSASIKSFRIAVGQGIIYNTGTTTINVTTSHFRSITFNDAANGSPFSTTSALLTYMNNKLRFNTNDTPAMNMQFKLTGNHTPTFPLLLAYPATFMLYINDGYYTNNGVVCTVPIQTYITMASFTAAVKSAMNSSASTLGYSNPFLTTGDATYITINPASIDRTSNGIFEFYVGLNSSDIYSNTSANSILGPHYLGLINNGPNTNSYAEAYDLNSCINITTTGVGPYTMVINGVGSSIGIAFQDTDGSNPAGFFSTYIGTIPTTLLGIPTLGNGYYFHTRLPVILASQTILNYGGNFNAYNISCNNLTVSGTVIYSGTVTFSGVQTFNNITTNNISITGTTSLVGSFDGGSVLPINTNTRLNYNGTLFASQFIGDSFGVHTSTYIYSPPYYPITAGTTSALGYILYSDGSGATPSSGSGTNTGGMSIGTTSTSVLFSNYDFILVKPGSNQQGSGLSYDFSIDRGMTTQAFQVSFLYTTDTNYVSGDIGVFLYDKTNLNLIPLSTSAIPLSSSPSMFIATFLPSTSVNYRLIFHVTTINSLSYNLQFNAVAVAPMSLLGTNSTMIGSWNSYPMIIGAVPTPPTLNGTISANIAQWRRSGSDMELTYNYVQSSVGVVGSGTYLFQLPIGYTIDWSKLSSANNSAVPVLVGHGRVLIAAAAYYANVYFIPSLVTSTGLSLNNITLNYETTIGADLLVGSVQGGVAANAIVEYHFYAKVPIAQWNVSSNLATDYQEYAYNTNNTTTAGVDSSSFGYGANGNIIYSFAPSLLTTVEKQVQFQKTINNRDDFIVEFMNPAASSSTWMSADQMGYGFYSNGTTNYGVTAIPISSTNVAVRFYSAANPNSTWASINPYYWRLRKRSQGNTAEMPPVIRAEYNITSASITSSNGIVNFDTAIEDTHSSVTPGLSWKFTASMPGVYSIESLIALQSGVVFTSGQAIMVFLYKNNAQYTVLSNITSTTFTTTKTLSLIGNKTIRLKTGDYINLVISYDTTSMAYYIASANNQSKVSVERIGS